MAQPEATAPIDKGYLGRAEFRQFGEEAGSIKQASFLCTQLCFPVLFPTRSAARGGGANIVRPWKLGLDVLLRADIQFEPITGYAEVILPSNAAMAHNDFEMGAARHAVMNSVIAADSVVHFAKNRQDRANYLSPKTLTLLEEELPLWIARNVSAQPQRSGRGWKKFLAPR